MIKLYNTKKRKKLTVIIIAGSVSFAWETGICAGDGLNGKLSKCGNSSRDFDRTVRKRNGYG